MKSIAVYLMLSLAVYGLRTSMLRSPTVGDLLQIMNQDEAMLEEN
jgi:chemotaxis protein histidine kinase CheA